MQRLLLLLLSFSTALRAQQPSFVAYSLAQGLPQSQVYAVMQDSRGYLWLGTQGGGLCRYDGIHFQPFTTESGLPSNYINALTEDGEHRLWVGTNAGVCYRKGAAFEKLAFAEGSGKAQILALARNAEGEMLVGADRGLFRCNTRSGILEKVTLPGHIENTAVWAILSGENGVWIATDLGAFRLGDRPVALQVKNGLPSNAVRALAYDASGRLWIGCAAGGLALWDEKEGKITQRYSTPTWPTCLTPDDQGRMWVGTSNNGVALFQPSDSSWQYVTEKQGFPHQYVRAVCADQSGNVWVGTSGGGVVKFLESRAFTHYDATQGLAGNRVYALHQDSRGRILLAVSQQGLQVLDTAGFGPFTRDSGLLNGVKSRAVAEDLFGRIWVGTEGKGLMIFDSSGIHRLRGLPSDVVQRIVPGTTGEMWIATGGGIVRVTCASPSEFTLQQFGKKEGLKGLVIATLHFDRKGRLWFADQLGNVGYIQNGKLESIFGPDQGLTGAPVRCMTTDDAGRLWVGTKGAGILVADATVDPLQFKPVQTPHKLPSDNIYLLFFDAAGNLWAGSESGVDKIALDPNTGQGVEARHYGKSEGFLGIETCQDACLCDRNGNLWFGTMNGLMKYNPSGASRRQSAPMLTFEGISLFYKPLDQTRFAQFADPAGGLLPGLQLPWDQNHLSFEFRAVDLAHPEAVRYRWRLDGTPNAQWSPLSAQTAVNFAGLQPGQYRFSVEASSDGYIFSRTLTAGFEVLQPFWQKPGFQAAMAGLLILAVWLFMRARIRKVKKAEAEKRAQLELQNHLLQLEQKALQLQMNPHFLFNALNSIQSLVGAGDTVQARREIAHFAQLMRSILNNSRRPFVSLREEADMLDQYLRIEQFCQQNPFEYHIELPEGIDAEELEIPPMLLQPFVENAVVHGVSHLQWPGKIEVLFRLEGAVLTCIVRDNGVGREKAARIRQERKPGHQSVALGVTRERLEALRGEAGYQSLEYVDLKNEQGEIAGTQVTVRLPAQVNF